MIRAILSRRFARIAGLALVAHAAHGSVLRAQSPTPGDSAAARGAAVEGAAPADSALSFVREVFEYDSGSRRDPFVSLLASGDLRPMLSDLRLTGIVYDPTGRRPIAVMRDITTKDQYRVTTGQTLGRMRVTQIQPRSVIFTIEEFGYSRQEVLTLGDSTGARRP
ncbi:MAG: hypothetical protein ACRENI_13180 [Gemmatimonadaceae bacterium]